MIPMNETSGNLSWLATTDSKNQGYAVTMKTSTGVADIAKYFTNATYVVFTELNFARNYSFEIEAENCAGKSKPLKYRYNGELYTHNRIQNRHMHMQK